MVIGYCCESYNFFFFWVFKGSGMLYGVDLIMRGEGGMGCMVVRRVVEIDGGGNRKVGVWRELIIEEDIIDWECDGIDW